MSQQMILRVNLHAIRGGCRPDHHQFAMLQRHAAVTATGDKEPSRQSGDFSYATKGLQTSTQDMKDNESLAGLKECKTWEKYCSLLTLTGKSLEWKC